MITPEILSYIKNERAKGTPEPLIRSNLLDNGWHETDITEAVSSLTLNPNSIPATINPVASAELNQYRKKTRLIVFCVLTLIDIFYLYSIGVLRLSTLSQAPASYIFTYLFINLCIAYGISYIATRNSKPKGNQFVEIGTIIAKIIGAIILTIVILIGIIFALCVFGGLGRGL